MIGAIKIKDGLFIGDEMASQVRPTFSFVSGPRVRRCKQSNSRNKLCRQANPKPLGTHRSRLLDILLARLRQPDHL